MSVKDQKTILLVEDEAILALAEKNTLENFGYNVLIAHSGEDAVAIVAQTPAIDLILMDINLGSGMDGTEAAALILKQRDIPVVFLSSHIEPEIVGKTEKITSYGYMVKASSNTVLDASIKMAFKLFAAKIREKEKESRMEAALEKLRKSEEKYSLINDSSRDSIYSYNSQGRFTSANRNLCDLLRLEPNQIIGRTHAELGFPESQCLEWDNLHRQVYETGNTVSSETSVPLPDGKIHCFEVILNPLRDHNGNIIGIGGSSRDICERKREEEELRKLASVVRYSSELINLADLEGKMLFLNEAGSKTLGIPAAEVERCSIMQVVPPHFKDKVEKELLPAVLATGSWSGDMQYLNIKTGQLRDFHSTVFAINDPDTGKALFLANVSSDITDRKRAEVELLRKNQIQQALNTYSYQVADMPREELYPFIIKEAREIFQVKYALLSRYDEASRKLVLKASSLSGKENSRVAKLLGQTTLGFSLQVDSEMYAEIMAQKSTRKISLHEATLKKIPEAVCRLVEKTMGLGFFHGASMIADKRLIGVLMLVEHPNQVFNHETEMLSFAAITANALMREKNEAALRASEEKYRTLIENSHDILFTLDLYGIFVFVSPSWTAILGHPLSQVVGKAFAQFIHPDDLVGCMALIQKIMETGQAQEGAEYRVCHADGSWRWHITNAVPIKDAAGAIVGGEGIARDITERKQAEAQRETALATLRESEEHYRLLIENVGEGIAFVNPEEQFVFANAASEAIFGMLPNGLPGRNLREFVRSEQFAMIREQTAGRQVGEKSVYEIEIIRPEGEKRNLLITAVPQFDSQGKFVGTFGIFRDISARKEAEAEIKRQLAEKEILLKEVHHRIKNNITSIGALISLHLKEVSNPEAIAVLQDAMGRVNSMGLLYDKLLFTEGYKDVSVKNYVESLADTVIALFPGSARIRVDKHIDDFQLDLKRLFPLGIIINELLTNKMKYAFIDRDNGVIKISLTNVKSHITLTIQDNGNELPAGFDIHEEKGFGLKLVKMLCQQFAASFLIENQAGTRCQIEFNN